MGWFVLFVLGGAAFGAMVALGVKRSLWSMIGSALMLAGAG